MPVIKVTGVSKNFHLQIDRPRSFQELVLGLFESDPHTSSELLWALRDVSFSVEAGETVGIVGANGSGKSTCLKLLTRILEPTSGEVEITGRVASMIELGAGFHPELTGRENIFLHGSILGLKRRRIEAHFDEIVAFSELERFIDVPVKFYSSGMYVRLAFASAINVEPDILLIDEVLAVGDQRFQEKCLAHIESLKNRGVTIVFVSHNLDTVRDLCERAFWLDEGILREDGPSEEVIKCYLEAVQKREAPEASSTPAPAQATSQPSAPAIVDGDAGEREEKVDERREEAPEEQSPIQPRQWGSGEIEITRVSFLEPDGRAYNKVPAGAPVIIDISYQAHEPIDNPVFGIAIHRRDGLHITGINTSLDAFSIPMAQGRGHVQYRIDRLSLEEGSYCLSVAVHSDDMSCVYDYQEFSHHFHVICEDTPGHEGIVNLGGSWTHKARVVETTEETSA
jgi:ABC-type polysaccharide/polyol phosphate transport system ATPase subunit